MTESCSSVRERRVSSRSTRRVGGGGEGRDAPSDSGSLRVGLMSFFLAALMRSARSTSLAETVRNLVLESGSGVCRTRKR